MTATAHPFDTLLVANRGEIARRVIRSAREAGLATVAVYSDDDREALHVREADSAVRLGPAPAAQSYLSIEAVLHAARVSGAEAIHPGYGFLSERADFAAAVGEAGLVFVGPPAEVVAVMGRKDHARAVAERAGVPVVPRSELAADGVADPRQPADNAVGFPVIVKAAAGGGGKGMRIVRAEPELRAALESARREAAAAFGNDTLLIERYLENGRHVEVQVLADCHGSVVHLFERDCSVQRRHQKLIEEAPAPTISEAVRRQLTSAAVALAREVGYRNAGTVEFLVANGEVFFLEMNTRLQVEHPVTELVTGLDLVRLQLLVAAGDPLPFGQDDVLVTGHAIEARVYAEDPYSGFLPQAGRATIVRWPRPERARVDGALESGSKVTTAYDPLVAKIIAGGPTREAARRNLVAALDETAVVGLTTNVGFLRSLLASSAYQRAEIHTSWLDADPAGARACEMPEIPRVCEPIAAWVLARVTARVETAARHSPFGTADGWRLAGPAARIPVELRYADTTSSWQVDPVTGEVRGSGGGPLRIGLVERGEDRVRLDVDGVVVETTIVVDAHQVTVTLQGQPWVLERPDAFAPSKSPGTASRDVVAPMPGTVLSIDVVPGDRVATGQVLGVLEAMKMELALKAPHNGTVERAGAVPGDQLALGDVVFTVEPDEGTLEQAAP
ncbi:MAG: biotin carboxylase N-terminal domain-containing protein [Nocardioidaceae bacterium]